MKKLTNKYIYIISIILILTIIAYVNINQNNIDSNQLQLEFLEIILSTRNQNIIDSNQEIPINEQIKLEEIMINKNLKNFVYLTNAGDGSNNIFLVLINNYRMRFWQISLLLREVTSYRARRSRA